MRAVFYLFSGGFLLSSLLGPLGCSAPNDAPDFDAEVVSFDASGLLVNGDFEAGTLAGWTKTGTAVIANAVPHSGTYNGRVGGSNAPTGLHTLRQSFYVPENSTSTLTLWAFFNAQNPQPGDYQRARLLNSNGTVLVTLFSYSTSNTQTWTQYTHDVTPYAGTTITLQFEVQATQTGFSPATYLRIDDVSFSTEAWEEIPGPYTAHSAAGQDLATNIQDVFGIVDSPDLNAWGTPCVVDWDNYTATTKGACLISELLKAGYGYSGADLELMFDSTSPSSALYFSAIENGVYFNKIEKCADIQAGDILAINQTATYDGHAVLIETAARMNPANPIYSGTVQWKLGIIDSTSSAHGATDSRYVNATTTDPGMGRGFMRVYCDAVSGNLLGHTWSTTSSQTSYQSPSVRPYRVGRLADLPAPYQPPPPPP